MSTSAWKKISSCSMHSFSLFSYSSLCFSCSILASSCCARYSNRSFGDNCCCALCDLLPILSMELENKNLLCMVPMTLVLRGIRAGCEWGHGKIKNHPSSVHGRFKIVWKNS